jgi:hypothetical protein
MMRGEGEDETSSIVSADVIFPSFHKGQVREMVRAPLFCYRDQRETPATLATCTAPFANHAALLCPQLRAGLALPHVDLRKQAPPFAGPF